MLHQKIRVVVVVDVVVNVVALATLPGPGASGTSRNDIVEAVDRNAFVGIDFGDRRFEDGLRLQEAQIIGLGFDEVFGGHDIGRKAGDPDAKADAEAEELEGRVYFGKFVSARANAVEKLGQDF